MFPTTRVHDDAPHADRPGVFRKARAGAPAGYFTWEAAGLAWLASADGAPVARVLGWGDDHLDLERLSSGRPTPEAARQLGRGLAGIHAAGAHAFGSVPPGWSGDGFLGPLEQPLPLPTRPSARWGEFYATSRLAAALRLGRERDVFTDHDLRLGDRVCERLGSGEFDDGEPPARLHGDLWSGNIVWTPRGAVLIDPAAHGGHRESDLAMLALFGAPHLREILEGYQELHRLTEGWRHRVGLHQLHPVAVHAVLFGGGYLHQLRRLLGRYASGDGTAGG